MILDIIIVLILLLFIFLGFKNGFIHSLLVSFGWIIAIVLSIVFNDEFREFLRNNTSIFDKLYIYSHGITVSYLNSYLENGENRLPGIIIGGMDDITDSVAAEIALRVSEVIFALFAFILMLVVIKLIFFILAIILSKHFNKGFVGGIDGVFGALFGILQGTATVLIILAIIVPATLLINNSWYNWVVKSLDNSIIAGVVYEYNPLRIVVEGYIPEEFMPSEFKENTENENLVPDVDNMI